MSRSTHNSLPVLDRVYCISLKQCTDRQENARSQLARMGIDKFEFLWGTGKDDPIVSEYYDGGRVLTFPPCFRCLKRSCGRDTCNNFLIPAQVATFISFKRVWEDMVANDIGIAMVVEDDVVFADYAPSLAQSALNPVVFSNLGITPDSESLLRLGTSNGEECTITSSPQLKKGIFRASNYCFVMTLGMAKRLLASFTRVETTADNYIHFIVGMKVNNYTLFPPLAYDLSWSLGAVDSLIHPKPKRVNYLQQSSPNDTETIAKAQQKVDRHFFHMLVRDVLVVGHPRCGSAYMSQLLKAYGLDVRHEEMGAHGISSWMFAVVDENNPWAKNKYALSRRYTVFDYVIHHVRNPEDAIPSIIRENRHSDVSYQFRRKHIKLSLDIDLDDFASEIDKATASFLYWNKIIELTRPDAVVRVEDCVEEIHRFLMDRNLIAHDKTCADTIDKTYNSDKPYKGVRYDKPMVTDADWASLNKELRKGLKNFCQTHRYDILFCQ